MLSDHKVHCRDLSPASKSSAEKSGGHTLFRDGITVPGKNRGVILGSLGKLIDPLLFVFLMVSSWIDEKLEWEAESCLCLGVLGSACSHQRLTQPMAAFGSCAFGFTLSSSWGAGGLSSRSTRVLAAFLNFCLVFFPIVSPSVFDYFTDVLLILHVSLQNINKDPQSSGLILEAR